jgi:4-amino-4-deoxy-L-arabinose transferase-like glycosyltransferase
MPQPSKKIILVLAAVICIFYAIYFTPIIHGDSNAYITLARQFSGTDESHYDLSSTSPFYSIVLGLFMKVLGEKASIQFMIYLQFFSIFLISILLYKIFEKLIDNITYLIYLILFYLFNLSTIYYGFSILTETLTQFIFVYICYLLIKYIETQNNNWLLLWLGFISAILVLARFNLILLPFFIWLTICTTHYYHFRFKNIRFLLKKSFVYFFPVFLILNVWCYKNYIERGYYFLWAPEHMPSNYVLLPMVDEKTKVSPENQGILRIVLHSKNKLLSKKDEIRNNSILKYLPVVDVYKKLNSGFGIFVDAHAELEKYFLLNKSSYSTVFTKMKPFMNEVSSQNKMNIFFLRVYSFFHSFKWTFNSIPENSKINLNILPSWIILLYKLAYIMAMIVFMLFTFYFYLKNFVRGTLSKHLIPLVLLILISYFPLMNFIAITYVDANRYKFPSEPLILGMIFYYLFIFKKNTNMGE